VARKGDRIIVNPAKVGQLPREGEILEVVQGNQQTRYRVRWDDGHESLFSPAMGTARIEPRPRRPGPPTKAIAKRTSRKR
jgi:hypothetical protein